MDPASAELLGLAENLLALYAGEPVPNRAEIEETAAVLARGQRDPRLAKGLHKLIQDQVEFTQPGTVDFAACRSRVLALAAQALRDDPGEDPEDFHAAILAAAAPPEDVRERGIYGDLPQFEYPLAPPRLSPQALLERYNTGLVQALLLTAAELRVKVGDPEPAQLRRLFKYLKFFRLLARVTVCRNDRAGGMKSLELEVAGPASVLGQNRRYGLQLASFFPAVCDLDSWKLETTVEWRDQRYELRLDQRSGLVGHYRNFSAYVPEEIQLFHRDFQAKGQGWSIVASERPLRLEGGEHIFPDLSFQNGEGRVVHLELFHRWHAGPLVRRLHQLAEHTDLPLILGVDRAVAARKEAKEALEGCPWFEERGFLFRDYPTVERTRKCLDRFAR